MADKAITELQEASRVYGSDLFVLEQGGTAKKLSGNTLISELAAALDGHGGIKTIVKSGTSGLVDTYRITYADDTTSTYTVANGNGIASIDKVSTADLTDTYRITYTNGGTYYYAVKNGEKGDTGEAMFVWLKYASVDPTTSAAPSMGDVPDDWMGIYSGYAASAPSDPAEYRWYNIKGQTGNTGAKGDPGDTYRTDVTYGVSDSPSVYPITWYSSVTSAPAVSGAYVWTRVQYINKDNQVVTTAYSVSHIGENGTGAGTVTSITFGETTYRDVGGNVSIPMPTSAEVGAIADPASKGGGQFLMWDASASQWVASTPTGSVTTVNGKGVTAGTTNIQLLPKDIGAYHKRNLLDNSDFTNPVNQRGVTSGTSVAAYGYFIDRWTNQQQRQTAFSFADNGITLPANTTIMQRCPNLKDGDIVTLVVCLSSGDIMSGAATVSFNADHSWKRLISCVSSEWYIAIDTDTYVNVVIYAGESKTIKWAALYEGEYTAETLPEYQPKGYGAELAECQRYYQKYHFLQYETIAMAYQGPGYAFMQFPMYRNMRANANTQQTGGSISIGSAAYNFDGVGAASTKSNAIIGKNYETITNPAGSVYCYTLDPSGVTIELIADL